MQLAEAVAFMLSTDVNGGPEAGQHSELDSFFAVIMSAHRNGSLSREDVERLWAAMPNAFGADTLMGHGLRKPYGYAGDFEMIDRIYLRSVTDNPRARRWDEYFQSRPACDAVRNRRDYFLDLVAARLRSGRPVSVLDVASGPARDVAECLQRLQPGDRLELDGVDMDPAAIAHAEALCRGAGDAVTFHHANIFRWQTGKRYDLVWSAGLFDYLDDGQFVALARRLLARLAPAGRMVVGNFAPANPTRDFMEFGEWRLNHRDDQHLQSLGRAAGGSECRVWIEREPCGINLFLNLEPAHAVPGGGRC